MHRQLIAPAALILAFCSGCSSAAGDAVHSAPTPVQQKAAPVLMFVGDSFTVGSGPVPTWGSYASETARLLGWQPVIAGAGGTGYLNKGRVGRTFRDSFEAELAWRPAPDLLVISGGHNDRRWHTLGVRRAAAELLWTVRARWPETRMVMVGPIWLDAAPPKAFAVRDALAEVAAREEVTFLDPLRQRWITGRRAEVLLPDGVHPTFAGHADLARWLAGALEGAGLAGHQGP
ncbi:SGNH/GDSL hydrolase family protein [Nonomuraea typhae]|uniref:SGNH/GDSL hydrolase family protein n=1 Tax=Nonomuraea typhae TaxID=2603600 RepID=UPI0012FA9E01|nr:SGNH/GDSL hydrolase family protein [Nonomuraea typhae]